MNLKVLARSSVEPVLISEAKTYLRIDHTDEDSLVGGLITAARDHVERYTRRVLIYTAFRLTLDTFPPYNFERYSRTNMVLQIGDIELPRSPVVSLDASVITGIAYATPRVRYWDGDGVQQTMVEGTDYDILIDDNPPRIVLPPFGVWPLVESGSRGSVEIDFVAGYGASSQTMPPLLKQAILMLCAHWYENRMAVGSYGTETPFAVDSILKIYSDGGYN